MQNNPIGWIEIPVTDLDRAEKWYSDLFGYEMQRQEERFGFTMSWFPMDMKDYGSAATLIKGDRYTPSHDGPLIYFSSPGAGIDEGIAKAEELGIKILEPKFDTKEHGFYAVLEDSEGNRIAIHSMNE